jgi:hypothetical protein
MATTTNYGWTTPDDTALVKDGAAAIRTLGTSVDTTTKNLNPSTTLGDIEYRSSSANVNTRLGIGSTGDVLTVTGGVPVWAAPAGGAGPAFQATQSAASQTFAAGTNTKLQYNNEVFDTDACYDPTTNYRFTPNKSGYYQINAAATVYRQAGGTQGTYILSAYKNGTKVKTLVENAGSTTFLYPVAGSFIVFLNGTTDYIEIFAYGDGGGTTQDSPGGAATGSSVFQASYLRS